MNIDDIKPRVGHRPAPGADATAKNGFAAGAEVIAHNYEGLVAKEEASLYEAGPTRRWLKVKQKGWTDAEDRWQRRIGERVRR